MIFRCVHWCPPPPFFLAELEPAESIALQQRGVGLNRALGCGIFLPHKSLAAVGSSQEND
ncbi:MAG: type I-MYXAN CRISPR-associated protein Cas6/Cmx6 [Gammaproteobacteria bacterium]